MFREGFGRGVPLPKCHEKGGEGTIVSGRGMPLPKCHGKGDVFFFIEGIHTHAHTHTHTHPLLPSCHDPTHTHTCNPTTIFLIYSPRPDSPYCVLIFRCYLLCNPEQPLDRKDVMFVTFDYTVHSVERCRPRLHVPTDHKIRRSVSFALIHIEI